MDKKEDVSMIRPLFLFKMLPYSATFVESQQVFVESQFASDSQHAFVESQVASTADSALLAALLPHDANEIAINAAHTNTNFFIFLPF